MGGSTKRTLTELHELRRRAEANTAYVPPEEVVLEAEYAVDLVQSDPDNPAVWYEAAIVFRAMADALTDMTMEVMSR